MGWGAGGSGGRIHFGSAGGAIIPHNRGSGGGGGGMGEISPSPKRAMEEVSPQVGALTPLEWGQRE